VINVSREKSILKEGLNVILKFCDLKKSVKKIKKLNLDEDVLLSVFSCLGNEKVREELDRYLVEDYVVFLEIISSYIYDMYVDGYKFSNRMLELLKDIDEEIKFLREVVY